MVGGIVKGIRVDLSRSESLGHSRILASLALVFHFKPTPLPQVVFTRDIGDKMVQRAQSVFHHEKTSQRGENRVEFWAGEGKTRATLGLSGEGGSGTGGAGTGGVWGSGSGTRAGVQERS